MQQKSDAHAGQSWLAVDLDGSLLRSDLLAESVLALLARNVLYLFLLPVWLLKGRARLKREVARRIRLDAARLPYNQAVNATLPAGQTMLWHFSVLEDEIISVKATPLTASSDLVLVLRGPDGYLQFTLDNTGSGGEELLLEFTVPAGGNWIILVREFQGRATSYRLKVEHR